MRLDDGFQGRRSTVKNKQTRSKIPKSIVVILIILAIIPPTIVAFMNIQQSRGRTELSKRLGPKPYDLLKVNGQGGQSPDIYRGERLIYIDPSTGKEVWRMTNDPAASCHRYHNMLVWNADGSVMKIYSHRSLTVYPSKTWLLDSDGSKVQSVEALIGQKLNSNYSTSYDIHWSSVDPGILYSLFRRGTQTEVRAINIFKGTIDTIGTIPGNKYQLWVSHDDKRFLLTSPENNLIYMLDGESARIVSTIIMDEPPKRPRFTEAPDYSIYYTLAQSVEDIPRVSMVMDYDGSNPREISKYISHPDWSPDGSEMFVYGDRDILIVDGETSEHRTILYLGAGAHGSWSLDGEWVISDAPNSPSKYGKFANMIFMVRVDGSGEVIQLCEHNSSNLSWSAQNHPDIESTHPAPVSSPDATKVAFNSDMAGEYSDVYVVIARRPDAPSDISMQELSGKTLITWTKPERSKELKGYNLYIIEGGKTVRANSELIEDERYILDRIDIGKVAITSVEHSKLESELPEEFVKALPEIKGVDNVSVCENSQGHIWLEWEDSNPSFLYHHYNIYSSEVRDFSCDTKHLIGSPTETDFIDWGLKTDTLYYYRITAVDPWGRESVPSEVVDARTNGQ